MTPTAIVNKQMNLILNYEKAHK